MLRTSAEALAHLRGFQAHIDELWLDHDLGGDDTIRPLTSYLEERAFHGNPLDVGLVLVHTANAAVGNSIVHGLRHYGYRVRRTVTDELVSAPAPITRPQAADAADAASIPQERS